MASITGALRRKGLLSSRRTTLGMQPRQVSPSLPALEHESSSSSTTDESLHCNDDSRLIQSKKNADSVCSSSSQDSRASDDCVSTRHEKRGLRKKQHTCRMRNSKSSTSMETQSSASDSMETQAARSPRRRFKQATKWYFRVGKHADERSYGTAEKTVRRWSEDDFDFIKDIGEGQFGLVFLATDMDNEALVAIKEIIMEDVLDKGSVECLRNEVEIQTRCVAANVILLCRVVIKSRWLTLLHLLSYISLSHENILQSFGYFRTEECINLVLEYAAHGNLFELKDRSVDEKLPLDLAQHFVRQVTSALAYLESQHVAHRDVKSENVVLFAAASLSEATAKLCDFGYAVRAPPNNDIRKSLCGTPEFMPPEMLLHERKYMAGYVDRWALGVLAYELVMGKSPFYLEPCEKKRIAREHGYKKKYQAIFVGIRNFSLLERPEDCDERLFDFCSALMQRDPQRRMSATEALEHPWLCAADISREQESRGRKSSTSRRATKRVKVQEV